MSKKELLIIRSPYKGIMKTTKEIKDYCRRNDIELLGIQYTGNIPLKVHHIFSDNLYEANHFNLQPLERIANEQEVVSLRLSDVFQWAKFYGYNFNRKYGLSLEGTDEMYKNELKTIKNKKTIERLATLIYDRVNGVLPIWSEQTGGAGFQISKDNISKFFDRIGEHKQLKIKYTSVEKEDPIRFLSYNF